MKGIKFAILFTLPLDGTVILDILFIYLFSKYFNHTWRKKGSLSLFQATIKYIQILFMKEIILCTNNISLDNFFSV